MIMSTFKSALSRSEKGKIHISIKYTFITDLKVFV